MLTKNINNFKLLPSSTGGSSSGCGSGGGGNICSGGAEFGLGVGTRSIGARHMVGGGVRETGVTGGGAHGAGSRLVAEF